MKGNQTKQLERKGVIMPRKEFFLADLTYPFFAFADFLYCTIKYRFFSKKGRLVNPETYRQFHNFSGDTGTFYYLSKKYGTVIFYPDSTPDIGFPVYRNGVKII